MPRCRRAPVQQLPGPPRRRKHLGPSAPSARTFAARGAAGKRERMPSPINAVWTQESRHPPGASGGEDFLISYGKAHTHCRHSQSDCPDYLFWEYKCVTGRRVLRAAPHDMNIFSLYHPSRSLFSFSANNSSRDYRSTHIPRHSLVPSLAHKSTP